MRALDTIHRNATAQVQIVNDLLDVSRIVRGNVQLVPKLMSLETLVTLAVESIGPTAEAKGVRIVIGRPPEPLFVWADHDRLQQVLWNLLANAVKFTPDRRPCHRRDGQRWHGRCASKSWTPATASRRHSSPTCSSDSAKQMAARLALTEALGSALRSFGTSWSCTAAG